MKTPADGEGDVGSVQLQTLSSAPSSTRRSSSESSPLPLESPAALVPLAPVEDPNIDGGYGWYIVASLSVLIFHGVGISYCWGVIQSRLIASGVGSASSLSYVGSTTAACVAIFAILNAKLVRILGSRTTAFLGVTGMVVGELLSGFSAKSVGGLFVTTGLLTGYGVSLCFIVSSIGPAQWFRARKGLATGIVFSAGGVGGAIFSLVLEKLMDRVGVPWTFRIIALITAGTAYPAVWFIKDRVPLDRRIAAVEWALFKDVKFICILLAGGIGTFPLFVCPFFLPLYGQSLGYSSSTNAALVAGFNLCSAFGRLGFGALCDYIGPINSLLSAVLTTGISLLALWPFSDSLAPLLVFIVLNGASNGGFFSTMPTVISSISASVPVPVVMGMVVTSWAGGYIMGAPIAGYLFEAYGGQSGGLSAFRPAMYYAGSLALGSAGFLVVARGLRLPGILRFGR